MDSLEMRAIFDSSQHLHKHQKCLKQMKDLYQKYTSTPDLLKTFKGELRRDILFTLNCEPKSPYTKHTIEFIANFLRSLSTTTEAKDTATESAVNSRANGSTGGHRYGVGDESANNRSNEENRRPEDECDDDELGMESLGSESFTGKDRSMSAKEEKTFADIVVEEQLIRFLQNVKPHIRYNCCLLIRKLFTDLEDMDLDIYKELRKALLDRLRDKDKTIRSMAALALHRFQEIEEPADPVSDALKFHLNHDPDFRVRQSCLQALHPSVSLIDVFINATRDVKDIIRKTAFILIADKFNIKNFGIDKRLEILRNGLNERHSAVRKVVEHKLLPNWMKAYDNDVEALLYGLDIQSDPELIQRMLYMYFDHLKSDVDEDTDKTGFHKFIEQFKDNFLENYNLLTKVSLTVENSFLWRVIAMYCKDNDIVFTLVHSNGSQTDGEEMIDSDSQPMESVEENVEVFDTIVPDLPHYCRYLKIFIDNLMSNEYELNELMEFEFMFKQLLLMGELIEIGDEAQRQILQNCVLELITNEAIFKRIHFYVSHLMKIFAKNTDLNSFTQKTVEIIDTINSKAIEAEEVPVDNSSQSESIEASAEQLRQYEIEYAKLSVKIESLRDDLEAAQQNDCQSEADAFDNLIQELTSKMNDIEDRTRRAKFIHLDQSSQQSTQPSQTVRTQKTLTDDPIALERCLQIFCGCLQFGDYKVLNPIVLTLIDRLVKPSIPNPEAKIRSVAIKSLGLCSVISADLAKSYFGLFVQVLNLDTEEAQETALKSIFDILCIHGLNYFEQNHKSKQRLNISKQNKSFFDENCDNKENRSVNNIDREDTEDMDDDNDRTLVDTDHVDVLCSDSERNDSEVEEENEETFIELFTDLLENHLFSESDAIRLITAQGIAKLFILGRMYSPQLLSKLILIWYDMDSSEEMRQFLGVFLPIYSTVQMKANLKGENAFEECFIKTVETVFTEALNTINLDNLINFFIELISDDGHKILAKSVANQILTRMGAVGVDDALSNKYYLRVLSVLRLTEMSRHDIKEYKLLVKKIERNVNKLKIKTKVTTNRMQTIRSKIDKQIELIKQNTSQLSTIEDFGSLTLSLSLSQSLSERSQIDETILETK